MLLADFIRDSVASLSALYPKEEAAGIISILCAERLGTKTYSHILEPDRRIPDSSLPGLKKDLSRLLDSEPIQYVTGKTEFCGHGFKVTPDVLIPRPETELLVEKAIAFARGKGKTRRVRIIDLCTGSGCIAWSLAAGLDGAEVTGVDISERALEIAASQDIEVPAEPEFIAADIFAPVPGRIDGEYDILTANPPYIMEKEKGTMRSNVLNYEPDLALFVPDSDPLVFYRAVASWAKRLLAPGGRGIVEINCLLGKETADIFIEEGFSDVTVECDLSGRDRFVSFSKSVLSK